MTTAKNAVSTGLYLENCYLAQVRVCLRVHVCVLCVCVRACVCVSTRVGRIWLLVVGGGTFWLVVVGLPLYLPNKETTKDNN